MKKFLYLLSFTAIFSSCNKKEFETYHFFALGTLIDITIPSYERDKLYMINEYVNKLSNTISLDENKINNALINQSINISVDTVSIYNRALFYNSIDNVYNPAEHTVLKLYGFPEGPYKIPDNNTLENAKKNAVFKNLVLKDKKIYKTTNLSVDFSANAKGYIVDKTVEYMKNLNIKNFIINAGGDLYVNGSNNNGNFKIGIKAPDNNILNIVKIKNKALATSGNYERYFIKDGKKYNHIFSGVKHLSEEKYQSISIIADKVEYADGFATLFYLLDIDKIEKYCKLYNVAVLILTNNNKIVKLCNWEQYE